MMHDERLAYIEMLNDQEELSREDVQALVDELRELRADHAAMAERIQTGDRARDAVIEECAIAARQADRIGYEWVMNSLWDTITLRAANTVRALKTKPLS